MASDKELQILSEEAIIKIITNCNYFADFVTFAPDVQLNDAPEMHPICTRKIQIV